jgi:acyl carrier protein phosphodiesterase
MRLFGKRKESKADSSGGSQEAKAAAPVAASASVQAMQAEITRLKAQMDSFGELRKIFGDRFTRVNEVMGELRGMLMETNKDLQQIQLKAVKTVDLVEAVQPDKLMTEIRRQDVKVQVLKANIESNEARMDTILKELKEIRNKIGAFRGVEEIVKLSGEVKNELVNIRKVKSVAERHSDKVESIFVDFQKRVRELSEMEDTVKTNADMLKKLTKDFDQLKVKVLEKADKKEVDKLITTSKEFEDHTTKAISLVNRVFIEFEEGVMNKMDERLSRSDNLKSALDELAKESPALEKNLASLEELMRQKVEAEIKRKKKTNFVSWLGSKVSKKKAEEESEEGEDEEEVNVEGIGESDEDEL